MSTQKERDQATAATEKKLDQAAAATEKKQEKAEEKAAEAARDQTDVPVPNEKLSAKEIAKRLGKMKDKATGDSAERIDAAIAALDHGATWRVHGAVVMIEDHAAGRSWKLPLE